MTAGVVFIVLGAAFLHAAWNALLRSGADRFWSIVVMGVASASVALPLTFMLAPPARASWPYIGLSAFLQICYCLVLVRAYREGELGSIYPIARGSSPMLVTIGALVFAGEKLGPLALFGVAMVSCGIIGMTFGRGRPNVSSIVAALATGLFIASYTVADGIGSRLSGYPQSYAAWLFLFQGAMTRLSNDMGVFMYLVLVMMILVGALIYVWLYFAQFALIFSGKRSWHALIFSRDLMRKRFFKVATRIVVFLAVWSGFNSWAAGMFVVVSLLFGPVGVVTGFLGTTIFLLDLAEIGVHFATVVFLIAASLRLYQDLAGEQVAERVDTRAVAAMQATGGLSEAAL